MGEMGADAVSKAQKNTMELQNRPLIGSSGRGEMAG
jgi:hypothetical protein